MTQPNTTDPASRGESALERGVGRPVPERYYMRYLCDGYILADAFRPTPGWGSKGYHVEADKLPPHTDAEIVRCAQESCPPGYWLQHVEAIGGPRGRRDLFKKAVPWSRSEPPNVRAMRAGTGCTAEAKRGDADGR